MFTFETAMQDLNDYAELLNLTQGVETELEGLTEVESEWFEVVEPEETLEELVTALDGPAYNALESDLYDLTDAEFEYLMATC